MNKIDTKRINIIPPITNIMENITVGRKKRINKKESWEKVNGNKRNSKKLNILLAIICILLIGVLGSIFYDEP